MEKERKVSENMTIAIYAALNFSIMTQIHTCMYSFSPYDQTKVHNILAYSKQTKKMCYVSLFYFHRNEILGFD